ncbi:MAG: hypothetical protein JSV53_01995 [candidate division WOR-3 bacterium]|nr:MAG: hypothetical protein JSV53_01995 [candidate division WOR-3 bacterium]
MKGGLYEALCSLRCCGGIVTTTTLVPPRMTTIQNQESVLVWSSNDDASRKLPGGVYFITLRAGNYSEARKVLFVR